jgi:putative endonuclease
MLAKATMAEPDKGSRRAAERRGRSAEAVAALLLRAKLFRIVERRVKTPRGEIDIVARRGRLTVFAEVKARASHDVAIASVTPHQARRIRDAANIWLARNNMAGDSDCRFDIITVNSYLWPRHVQNAFAADIW